MMIKNFTLFIFLFFTSILTIQAQNFWKKVDTKNQFTQKKDVLFKKNFPNNYSLLSLDINGFKNYASKNITKNSNTIIELPDANGNLKKYTLKKTSYLAPELAAKFTMITSYSAQGINDPTATAKISIGTNGFHAVIFSGKGSTVYIDPYTKNKQEYIVYKRSDLNNSKSNFQCKVEDAAQKTTRSTLEYKNADDGMLRTYRIAIVATGEYSQFHINNTTPTPTNDAERKAAVLSAMNTTITRVNGVFEKDLGVRMVIVNNNENVIFLDATTDDLTNDDANALIDESQVKCDDIIGDANYDIGHTFSTGGGGLAQVRSVCVSGDKARGITGRANPINDPFDIDFVAHEIGHQFGGTHTQNNDCQRTFSTAVEPGSASTIMGYAGICSPDVQGNSDDYFHAVSIAQMWAHIQGTGSCATTTNTGNTAPTANAGSDFSIPKSTPFILKGVGNDIDGASTLTYNWEQIDNEIGTMPPLATNTAGPMFRSFRSSSSPNRYMPALTTVIGGSTASTWEVVPSVTRELNFAFTVRDNNSGGGNSARDDVKITVTDAEPFTITSQNTTITYDVGTTQTITWNKGTTDQAPINCKRVNIKLSTDGGETFPITLKENTQNDGSELITIPNAVTNTARIMVEAVDNIFYNVNPIDFSINSVGPTIVFTNTTSRLEFCNNENTSVEYILNFDFVEGFSETVTLSATGAPTGSNVSFTPTTINSNGDVTMSITNLNGAAQQDYTITIQGTTNSVTRTTIAELIVLGNNFSDLTLTAPINLSTDISLTPTFNWNADPNATSYDIEIATNSDFTNIIFSDTSNTNTYFLSNSLLGLTTYFWRVKPKSDCGEGNFSSINQFTTKLRLYCTSTFTDESGGTEHITNVTFNTINNNSGNDTIDGYQDFKNISTAIVRGDTHQISVTFNTGGFQDHCYVFIDWNQDSIFDINTERYDLGTGFEDISTAVLDIQVPVNAAFGETVMRVLIEYDDSTDGFGQGACDADHITEWGETEDYSILIDDGSVVNTDELFKDLNTYPIPSDGNITVDFRVKDKNLIKVRLFDLKGRLVSTQEFSTISSLFSEQISFNASGGVYLLKIENGGKEITRKIIIK